MKILQNYLKVLRLERYKIYQLKKELEFTNSKIWAVKATPLVLIVTHSHKQHNPPILSESIMSEEPILIHH